VVLRHGFPASVSPFLVVLLAGGTAAAREAGPVDVGSGKQFFVDEKLIARSRGIELTMNVPARMNQPVLASDTPFAG